MPSTLEMSVVTVADVALNMPQAIEVLNAYGLDYCCNGNEKFVTACRSAGLDPQLIWNKVTEKKELPVNDTRMDFRRWDVSLLIDFIVQQHHSYVRRAVPHIKELLHKICTVHSDDSPELPRISNLFNEIAEELLEHMQKEEGILFPAIRRLTDKDEVNSKLMTTDLLAPIAAMKHDHELAGDLIKQIRNLTNQYVPPSHACPTFQLTYKLLREFDGDLMQHVHLENNVLFPKAGNKSCML